MDRAIFTLRNLNRHLIVRAPDSAAFDFHHGLAVFQRLVKNLQRLFAGAFVDDVECSVNDLFSDGFLSIQHHAVHELCDQTIIVNRIRKDFCAWVLRDDEACQSPTSSAAWCRIWTGPVSGQPRLGYPRCREQCDIATPGRSFTRPPRMSTVECS